MIIVCERAFEKPRHFEAQHCSPRGPRVPLDEQSGMVHQCAWCRRVRDTTQGWRPIEETYAAQPGNVTHGICPSCYRELMGNRKIPRACELPSAKETT